MRILFSRRLFQESGDRGGWSLGLMGLLIEMVKERVIDIETETETEMGRCCWRGGR